MRTKLAVTGLVAVVGTGAWLGLSVGGAAAVGHNVVTTVAYNSGHFQLDPPGSLVPQLDFDAAVSALGSTGVFGEYADDAGAQVEFGLLTENSRGSYVFGQFVPASVARPVWALTLHDVPVPPPGAGAVDGVNYRGDVVVAVDATTGAFVSAVIMGGEPS